jgi:Xaa-Pro aminopeptidase
MTSYFTSDFFSGNRSALQKAVGEEVPIVVAANGLLQRAADTGFPFQQDSNFWYLTGLDEPDIVLYMYEAAEYLILPPRTHVQNLFDGEVSAAGLRKRSGIKKVYEHDEGWAKLMALLGKKRRVATVTPSPAFVPQIGLYTNPAKSRTLREIRKAYPNIGLIDLRKHLRDLRMVKQNPEIGAIRQAVKITCDAFSSVQQREYSQEYQLEADLTQMFRGCGARGHAYEPIVAAGLNACTLHYINNSDKIAKSPVLVDAGAEVEHYAADITRTWVQGTPSDRQAAVIDAVKSALDYGTGLLKPGVSFADCEKKIRKQIGRELHKLGLINRRQGWHPQILSALAAFLGPRRTRCGRLRSANEAWHGHDTGAGHIYPRGENRRSYRRRFCHH